jgi:hypothetical protein
MRATFQAKARQYSMQRRQRSAVSSRFSPEGKIVLPLAREVLELIAEKLIDPSG